MKHYQFFILAIMLSLTFTNCQSPNEESERVQLILDTDFGSVNGDIDDMGALALAHGLMNNDECDLLAVMLCINNGHAMQAVDAVNTYFGRGDIPVANTDGELIYQDTSFAYHVAANFQNDIVPEESLAATKLYRKVLAGAEDNSVNIAVVGHPGNLHNLFKSGADEYSELSGVELFGKKVDTLYLMGGSFPDGATTVNFKYAGECVTKSVIENSPRPIVFSGEKIGKMDYGFVTGSKLNQLPDDNPVKACYEYWFQHPVSWYWNPPADSIRNHHHWDQVTVHTAVRGVQDWFEMDTTGYCQMDCAGTNQWITSTDKDHAFLKIQMDPETFSNTYIQPLMMALPQ
ncbi:MAG: hypothetical protein ACNS62_08675 [Candidatus Cyclobacteriaceae bacterium M3_2C_046]